jgi:hypothetical protein
VHPAHDPRRPTIPEAIRDRRVHNAYVTALKACSGREKEGVPDRVLITIRLNLTVASLRSAALVIRKQRPDHAGTSQIGRNTHARLLTWASRAKKQD